MSRPTLLLVALSLAGCAPAIVKEYSAYCERYGGPDALVVTAGADGVVVDLTGSARDAANADPWSLLTLDVRSDQHEVLRATWTWPALDTTSAAITDSNDNAVEWVYDPPEAGLAYQAVVSAEWVGDEREDFRTIECYLMSGEVVFESPPE